LGAEVMTQAEFAEHQSKQNDIKQFIQLLTPLVGTNTSVDQDVQKMAVSKMKELIPLIHPGIKETLIKKV
jgi:hypothetical protein